MPLEALSHRPSPYCVPAADASTLQFFHFAAAVNLYSSTPADEIRSYTAKRAFQNQWVGEICLQKKSIPILPSLGFFFSC